MSRTARFHSIGGPEVLKLEEEEVRAPGVGEVRLKVEAIGLNRAELAFMADRYLEPPVLPSRIGYEAAGTIEAVGPGVTGWKPGDRVTVVPAFSMTEYGTAAELTVVPARALVPWPEGLSAAEAASVTMQYLTAWGGLHHVGALAMGDAVLITAASSSVGLAAIQLTRAAGGTPIAATRTSAKREALLQAGAAQVIATAEEDLAAAVRRATDGRGARIIFDPIGGPGFAALGEAAAYRGVMILYGRLSGQPAQLPASMGRQAITARGFTLFEITRDPERLADAYAPIAQKLAAGVLRPIVARTFPFAQLADAYRFMASNEQIGKIVVTVP